MTADGMNDADEGKRKRVIAEASCPPSISKTIKQVGTFEGDPLITILHHVHLRGN